MKPEFRITADGTDITAAIRDRLVDLRITDEAGEDSDTVEMKLDDRDGVIELPRTGVELEVALGYGDDAYVMGLYVVDEISVEFVPAQLRITARAANFSNSDTARNRRASLRAPRSRDWHQVTLGEMVRSIAVSHGYDPRIAPDLAAVALEHVDQVDESDLNLLMRLSREHDAIAKPAGGHLVVVSRADSKTADGRQLEQVVIYPHDISTGSLVLPQRSKYSSVIAHYHDATLAEQVEVKAGDGQPEYRLRREYAAADAALTAAQARLKAFQRGSVELSISMPGNPLIAAATPLELQGFRAGVNGSYRATRVEHVFDGSGLKTQIQAEGTDAGDE